MSDYTAKERKATDAILAEALRLGVEIPRNSEWWWTDFDNYGGDLQMWEFVRDEYEYLTEIGKSGAEKLIREERRRLEEQKRIDVEWERKSLQWKLTIAGTIVGWIVGILGTLIGLIAVLRK